MPVLTPSLRVEALRTQGLKRTGARRLHLGREARTRRVTVPGAGTTVAPFGQRNAASASERSMAPS